MDVAERDVAHEVVAADGADGQTEPGRVDVLHHDVLCVALDTETVVLVPDLDIYIYIYIYYLWCGVAEIGNRSSRRKRSLSFRCKIHTSGSS